MKTSLVLFGFLATVFSVQVKAATCQNEYPFKSITGRDLIQCQVTGEVAKLEYSSLAATEEHMRDEDGSPYGGFTKRTETTYCFASEHKTTFACSVTLDARTREVLSLNAAIDKAL